MRTVEIHRRDIVGESIEAAIESYSREHAN